MEYIDKGILPQLCGTPLQIGEACFCRFQLFLSPDHLDICRLSRKKIQYLVWLGSPLNTQRRNKRISFLVNTLLILVKLVFKESIGKYYGLIIANSKYIVFSYKQMYISRRHTKCPFADSPCKILNH